MPEHGSTHYVIGSGPAGVACAHALLQRGANVCLIDAGIMLEPSNAAVVAQMQQTSPAAWTPSQLQQLKAGMDANAKGIPLKRVYGSDFPYRDTDHHLPADYENVALRPSLARGGLSNVWGATLLPYADRDIADWPIRSADLAQHYTAVAQLTGMSARRDDLEKLFPIYQPEPRALELSAQAKLLLSKLESNRESLTQAGVHFGQARVAVRTAHGSEPGCVYCGLCMYGCAYGYIFSSQSTLRELQRHPNFVYQPDIVVTHVEESAASVRIHGYQRESRAPFAAEATRVYLGAGVIPTTRILLRSQSRYDQTIWMKDSQYFLLPLVLSRSPGDVRAESLHTLSQLFLEILDPEISPHTVHLQIYSYNDLVGQAVRKTFGPLAGPLELLARGLERRLLIVQGYLHSDQSARIGVTLKKGEPDRMLLRAETRPETATAIRQVIRKLSRHSRSLGAFPLRPMLQIAEPGRGFHSGSTFPMNARPGAIDSDVLGRPSGWQRVHAIDATVLPSIPATTITFTVMANAHRIGWNSAE